MTQVTQSGAADKPLIRVYGAGPYSDREKIRGCLSQLPAGRYVVTARWLSGEHDPACETAIPRYATEDFEDATNAHILIVFPRAPRSHLGNGGYHVETGIALGRGKRVIVVEHRSNLFHRLPQVEFVASWEECLAALAIPAAPPAPPHVCPCCGGRDLLSEYFAAVIAERSEAMAMYGLPRPRR